MTWRITIKYINHRWFVSIDTLDKLGRKVDYAGGDFATRWQAMEFIDAETDRSGDD